VGDPGPRRWEMQPVGTRLPLRHGCGEGLVPAEEDARSEVSEWELRKLREREEGGGWRRRSWVPGRGGGGGATLPSDALFHGIHRGGVGEGRATAVAGHSRALVFRGEMRSDWRGRRC